MTNAENLCNYANERGIDVDWMPMHRASSLSVRLPDGTMSIALNKLSAGTEADKSVRLGHELGHCETGSFYNRFSSFDNVQQNENRADKWAIAHLVPRDELYNAIADGYTEIWQLAEYFNVTDSFIRKALWWYQNGNLAVEPE